MYTVTEEKVITGEKARQYFRAQIHNAKMDLMTNPRNKRALERVTFCKTQLKRVRKELRAEKA